MGFDFFVKLKYQSSSVILSVGIKYSMRDILCDVSNYACPVKYTSHTVNNIALLLAGIRSSISLS